MEPGFLREGKEVEVEEFWEKGHRSFHSGFECTVKREKGELPFFTVHFVFQPFSFFPSSLSCFLATRMYLSFMLDFS